MSDAISVALITAIGALLIELIRTRRTATNEHAHSADLLRHLRRDVGGLRADVRQTNKRLDRVDARLDAHLDS